MRALLRGAPLDPHELVEVRTAPLYLRPLAEQALRDAGIASTCTDAFSLLTKSCTDVRIHVARSDVVRAREILSDL